jgi:hypothetical protein
VRRLARKRVIEQIHLSGSARHLKRTPLSNLLVVSFAILLAATPVTAQVVYKLVDKNGGTVYSDHVIPGMRVVEKLAPPPPPDPELVAAARAAAAERARRAEAHAEERERALDAADAEVRQAEQALAAANRDLDAGLEPLPGERLGTIGFGPNRLFTRLSDAYWARIAQLQRAVSEATRRLERAYSERNALRD